MNERLKRLKTSISSVIFRGGQGRNQPLSASSSRLQAVNLLLRRHWTLVIGVVAAGLAFVATQHYAESRVNQERDRLLPRGGLVDVLVAARDLSVGEQATPVTVAIRQVPREWLLPNTLTPQDFDTVADQTLVAPVVAGSPLFLEHLRKVDRQHTGFQLEDGFRAVSISVDEVSSVGGLIQPGDFVDLWGSPLQRSTRKADTLLNLVPDSSAATPQPRLIAENLRVLATGQTTLRRDAVVTGGTAGPITPSYSSITLAVPSKIAVLVLGGQFQGRMGIALRSAADSVPSTRPRRASARSKSNSPPVEILVGGLEGGEE
jgi:pilus assembly protein CpaB